MIHYQLRCGTGHEFEGWFRDSTSFELQSETGLLTCPNCGTTKVSRGLMAPAVRTRRASTPVGSTSEGVPVAQPSVQQPPAGNEVGLPDEMRAMLQRVRAEVERNCDNVGDDFTAEALRMHRGEASVRGIYGNANEDDREALADEGIQVMQIPWLKPAES
ncbi:MAG: DUF1178 family protein [Janthinobacterium lividum]